ncbi:MAG: HypC/HybG/HupF family hydrogenase formation chaperone [Rhodomicrobium sp.]
MALKMCIGFPMEVVEPRSRYALCRSQGVMREIDMALVGEQPAGTWVLSVLNTAREVVTAEYAAKIADALHALTLVMQGETDVDHLFADLTSRQLELPPSSMGGSGEAGGQQQ